MSDSIEAGPEESEVCVRAGLRGGEVMEFPSWFQRAIQRRLEFVAAQIERNPELSKYSAEEEKAFEAIFSAMDITQSPEFMAWEDKHHMKRAQENEHLYLQGMRDGVQLAVALLSDPLAASDKDA